MKILDELIHERPGLNVQAGLTMDVLRRRFVELFSACWAPIAMFGMSLGAYSFLCLPFLASSSSNDATVQVREALWYVGGGGLLLIPLLAVSLSYTGGLIARVLTTEALEQPETLAASSRIVSDRLWHLIIICARVLFAPVLYLLTAVALMLGPGTVAGENDGLAALTMVGLLMLIAGIGVVPLSMVGGSLGVTIRVMEDVSPSEAIRRSKRLNKVNRLMANSAMSATLLLILITAVAGGLVIGLLEQFLEVQASTPMWMVLGVRTLEILPFILGIGLMLLYGFAATAISYIDSRISLEALDVDILARRAAQYGKRSRFRA
ncbi:MAG: hypothetical protein JNJ45_04215 [Chthonomonas sp.]|nr:hypothetical protein [Chthonomonas sp.]